MKTTLPSFRRSAAFSLVEVVIALGILAAAGVGVLAMLAPALRGARETIDRRAAAASVTAVERELREHARTGFADFDAFAAATSTPVRFVASAEGAVVEREGSATLAPRAQHFLVVVSRAASPAFQPGQAHVVLAMQVSWPYHGGAVAEREWSGFTVITVVTP